MISRPTRATPPRAPGSDPVWSSVLSWDIRRWQVAGAAAAGTALLVAVPTDLIDTPLFSRDVPPTWWSWPMLLVSSVLTGMLVGTYVRVASRRTSPPERPTNQRSSDDLHGRRWGGLGGALTFFAVGCPVCNKVVLLAMGSSGAMTWFQPVQPLLSVGAVVVLGWALHRRLSGETSCRVTS